MKGQKKAFATVFAQRIRELRIRRFGDKRGAQSAAAKAMDISPAEWRGYERGVLPGADRLAQICALFQCDANWLIGAQGDGPQLSESQKEFVKLLLDMKDLLQGFDAIHTRFLMSLPEALADPAAAQQSCHQLYGLFKSLRRIMNHVDMPEPPAKE